MKFLDKVVQVILDLLMGMAIYYSCTVIFALNSNLSVIITLFITAIFAEFYEVKKK